MSKKIGIVLLSITLFISCKTAQNTGKSYSTGIAKKHITLEDIWRDYTFYPRQLFSLKKYGKTSYSVLERENQGNTVINIYNFKDLKKISTAVSSADLRLDIDDYAFDKSGKKVLIASETEPIYRHSTRAKYYLYDLETKKITPVSDKKIQSPAFSPDGAHLAYVWLNNLYVKNLTTGENTAVTKDGKINQIINGLTDWVYEEEFGFVRAFQWNADGTAIAFLRFDERRVPEFSMSIFGKGLYPETETFKYPKAGENNSVVELYIYDLKTAHSRKIELPPYEYIPRIKWTKNPDILSVQCMNRLQNELNLYSVSRQSGDITNLYSEKSDTYINIRDFLTFLADGSFIFSNEQSGYQHLYLYDATGKPVHAITSGDWEVTDFYGYNAEKKEIYYQSTEDGSTVRTLYSIHLDGTGKKRLGPARGISKALFSGDMKYFILDYNDADTPPVYSLYASDGTFIREILNNEDIARKLKEYVTGSKEYSILHTETGDYNMWMIKPANFNPHILYPLLMYQYSGPGVQTVMDRWNGFNTYWYYMLAEKGYIIASVDGRGTGGRGAEFTHCTYGKLGDYETKDQIAAAKALRALPYIDAGRIGIWGWSFGGFTAANAIFKGNDVFRLAISVAPVTNWRFYDTVYTERYMGLPQDNPSGYDDNSPLNFAQQLKGKFLLIHGSGDDNVHVQNSMRLINAMISADVPFDSEIYPDRTHGIYRGRNTRLHLYQRMTGFITDNL